MNFYMILKGFLMDFDTLWTSKNEHFTWRVVQKSSFRLVCYRMHIGVWGVQDFPNLPQTGNRFVSFVRTRAVFHSTPRFVQKLPVVVVVVVVGPHVGIQVLGL